jgi:hypothetical protein
MASPESVAAVQEFAGALSELPLRPDSIAALDYARRTAEGIGIAGRIIIELPRKKGEPAEVSFQIGRCREAC